MEVLRRTQGIDFKAKNSSLMGSVEIQLKDADSGKVKEVVKQKNMFTNALDSLFNKSCFNIANSIAITASTTQSAVFPKQTPVINKALGGIILFPNALGSDANLLYPDFDTNYPTGYASQAEYTQDDSRQGAFNGNSSGIIPNTNSYKLVYDWGSSFGNGQIASVALSNSKCYKYFNDKSTSLMTPTGTGYFKQFFYNWSCRSIGYNNQGLVYTNNSSVLHLAKFPERKLTLWHEYDGTPPYEDFEIPNFTFDYGMYICVKDDYIHVFKVLSSTSFKYIKIDCSDWTNTETTFTDVGGTLTGAEQYYNTCAVRGNYVYLPKSGWGSLYKINLTNIADITEIEMPSGTTARYSQTSCGNIIYGVSYIIGTDDVVRTTSSSITTDGNLIPAYLDGVWCAKIPISSGTHGIYADVITPYCATHADLENAVTKTADKSMTVNYTVTQV